jgi:hypothetical protein
MNLVIATDKTVYFFGGGGTDADPPFNSQPLDQIGADGGAIGGFERNTRKRGHPALLIVPDHWIKHEYFPFQSTRDALIRAFLERKLKTSYPRQPHVADFFSFTPRRGEADQRGISAYFLEDERGARLHEALCQADLAPRSVTTPALLWAVELKHRVPDFFRQAALLVHSLRGQAFLYFFCEGDFLFSRRVALPEGNSEALVFEINQSLYLYSQKTKKELGRIYLVAEDAAGTGFLGQTFGRPVQVLECESSAAALNEEIEFLQGLLTRDGIAFPDDEHGITHRRIQKQMRWRPFQWAGILVGACLLAVLAVETHWIAQSRDLKAAGPAPAHSDARLQELESALDELIASTNRPSSAFVAARLAASLPEAMRLSQVKIDIDAPLLELSATVQAEGVDGVREMLKRFAAELSTRLRLPRPIRLEDFSFQTDDVRNEAGQPHPKITLKVPLP